MRKCLALLCILLVFTLPIQAASTSSLLTERSTGPLPQAKSVIGVDDPIVLQLVNSVLNSNLEPGQKSTIVTSIINQQYEAKSSWWGNFWKVLGTVVSVGASIAAVVFATTR